MGELDEAARLAEQARALAKKGMQLTALPSPASAAAHLQEAIALVLGQLDEARTRADEAVELARGESDVLPLADALLGQAEAALRVENLEAAVLAYNRVQYQSQADELALEQGLAGLGLGRVLLRRGLLEEAISTHIDVLPRFRAADDVSAQALTYLGLGEAYRLNGDPERAQEAVSEAARLYTEMGDPLGEAEASESEARLLLDNVELEAATSRIAHALGLVEGVGGKIRDAGARAEFFDGYAAFYCEGMLAAAREQNAESAHALAARYKQHAGKAGVATAVLRLREYEQTLTARGADTSKEDSARNKVIAAILAGSRKMLAK